MMTPWLQRRTPRERRPPGLPARTSSASRADYRDTVAARLQPLSARLVARVRACSGHAGIPLQATDFPVILWLGGAVNELLGSVTTTAWRRYVGLLLDSLLSEDHPD